MKDLLSYIQTVLIEGPKFFWAEMASYVKVKIEQRKIRHVIKIARTKTQLDRKHRYVVRTTTGEPIAVTSLQIEILKRKGTLPKHITCVSIYQHALEIVKYKQYHTHQMGTGRRIKESDVN